MQTNIVTKRNITRKDMKNGPLTNSSLLINSLIGFTKDKQIKIDVITNWEIRIP